MEVTVDIKTLEPYKLLYNLPPKTNIVVVIGGRGGGKTYEVSKFVAVNACIHEKRAVILRDEKALIRESILNEILQRYDTANEDGLLDLKYERLETGLKSRKNDSMVVFAKGFRASASVKTANLKGVSDIDIAVIEEAEDIRDKTKFDKFSDSIRKEGALIIIILNTPDINHWIIRRYFKLEEAYGVDGKILDGYFKIVPKQIDGFVCINTSYKDNPFLPGEIVKKYESYGIEGTERFDLHHFYTDILGYASSGRKGQVFKKVRSITLKEYLEKPYREYYGQDFGTTSPAGMVAIKKHRNNVYIWERNYKPKNVLELGIMYSEMNLHPTRDKVIGDNAAKDDIEKLQTGWKHDELEPEILRAYPQLRNGWDIEKCFKDSIESSIRRLNTMNIFIVEGTPGFWDAEKGEVINYVYAQDKNGEYLDIPVDAFNHLWDPTRYVVDYLEKIEGGEMERAN